MKAAVSLNVSRLLTCPSHPEEGQFSLVCETCVGITRWVQLAETFSQLDALLSAGTERYVN